MGLIHATHTLKCLQTLYFFSPHPKLGVSFITHTSIDKCFYQYYFLVKPSSEEEDRPTSMGQSHPISMIRTGDLTPEEHSLLQALAFFYRRDVSFPLRSLTEDPHTLAACRLFHRFPANKIGIISLT